MPEELVFNVNNERATAATPITLAQAGFREREHLQEWVLAHPQILGSDVMIVTSEFDRFSSRLGVERDRLDVLGLGSDGRLVVVELKRDAAPDTVEMQAIKYAAMVSRFDIDRLADAHAAFTSAHSSEPLSGERAREALLAHTDFTISDETLRAPRIVLIAGSFPPVVTATSVWLTEMGLDLVLIRIQAYQAGAEVVVTVSQHYPTPDVEDFVVAPTRSSRRRNTERAPVVDWDRDDLARLATAVHNVTIHATMDLCATSPGAWIASEQVQAKTGRGVNRHRGDYGGFGSTLKQRFGRSNAPFETEWAAGGTNQAYYKLEHQLASWWTEIRATALDPDA